MNKTKEIIINSLKYYDLNNEKYSKIYDKIKYYSAEENPGDIEHAIINLHDKNQNKFFSSRYEVLGTYNSKLRLWAWSWSVPYIRKNKTFLSRKLLMYGLDIEPEESPFLKSELITSRFKISDEIQLDIHAAVASYLSKNPMILRIILASTQANAKPDLYEVSNEMTNDSIVWYIFLLDERSRERQSSSED